MLITNMSAISLHHVKISFYERSKYLPFSSKSPGSRVYKIYYRWNYVRNIDCEALKIGKMPPKRVISASLGYERSSRSLYLLTFGGGMYQSGMNLKGLRSQIPINLRFMGNQPFIDHACWKKHMKKDSLLRTQFLNDSNEIRTQNYLVRKRILNHLAVLWVLICTVHLTVCYYHVRYDFQSESTFYSLPECQGTPFSKQTPYLEFKWQQRDSNPQPLSL